MRAHSKTERGVTLLELLIAISLVALLSTGMMLALRTSVQAYGKTGQRLESNRRTVGREQILSNQIGSAMAVTALCGPNRHALLQLRWLRRRKLRRRNW